MSCNGCPSTEGLKPTFSDKAERAITCCNGCPSTEGLKRALSRICFILNSDTLQWLSLDRDIEALQ